MRRAILLFLAALILVFAGASLLFALRLKGRVEGIQSHLTRIASYSVSGTSSLTQDISKLKGDLSRLREDLLALQQDLSLLLPLEPLLQRMPFLPITPGEGNRLIPGIAEVLQAGEESLDGVQELTALSGEGGYKLLDGGESAQRLMDALEKAGAKFKAANARLESVQKDTTLFELLGRKPQLKQYKDTLTELINTMTELTEMGSAAPDLAREFLGMEQPRTYLIMPQNTYEIRATGGFISAAWLITLDKGKITNLVFHDSPAVDDLTREYPPPPVAMFKYMQAGKWLFRDANWYADFPTTAKAASNLYFLGQRVRVDGVIAIDDLFVREVVTALEPIPLESFQETVTKENVVRILEDGLANLQSTTTELAPRKLLLKVLFEKLLEKARSGLDSKQTVQLLFAFYKGLKEKHVLLYVENPSVASLLAERNWDGALRPAPGDFLLVVDDNMGYDKVNHRIRQSLEYDVSWQEDNSGMGKLRISYTNTSSVAVQECIQQTTRGGYNEWREGCYWDFLRVYAAEGASLEQSTYIPLPKGSLLSRLAKQEDPNYPSQEVREKNKSVIGQFFVVPVGEEKVVEFTFKLAHGSLSTTETGASYSLLVQKQPGTVGHPLVIRVHAPPGMRIRSATPEAFQITPDVVEFRRDLTEDISFQVFFDRSGPLKGP